MGFGTGWRARQRRRGRRLIQTFVCPKEAPSGLGNWALGLREDLVVEIDGRVGRYFANRFLRAAGNPLTPANWLLRVSNGLRLVGVTVRTIIA